MPGNLHYIFYKQYFEYALLEEDGKTIKKYNDSIIKSCFETMIKINTRDLPYNSSIVLCTSYPGLLVGIGTPHYFGKYNEEINLGFSLDYVTGLPYIPGSTVKGCLRQAFSGRKREYVMNYLKLSKELVEELDRKIFGHVQGDEEYLDRGTDIFFDVHIIKANPDGKILGCDNITPHNEIDGKNNVIKLLKMLPSVNLQFLFKLTETELSDGTIITVNQKAELFKAILQDYGIGAKTNVGYGVLNFNELKNFNGLKEGVITEVTSNHIKLKVNLDIMVYTKVSKKRITYNGEVMDTIKLRKAFKKNDNVFITLDSDLKTASLEYNNQLENIKVSMSSD